MFNAIASSTKDIHTYNDGIAYSLGAILLVAGKTVHAAKNSMTMLHNGSTGGWGNSKTLREIADTLDKYDLQICEMFADKTGKTVEDIQASYMNFKDNYFTAKEAKESGLVDVIEDYKADVPEDISNMDHTAVVNYLKAMNQEDEDSFFNRIVDRLRATVSNLIPSNTTQIQQEEIMNFEKLNSVLDAAGDKGVTLTPEQVQDLKNEIAANKDVVTKAELDAVTLALEAEATAKVAAEDKATALQAKVDALDAEVTRLGALDGGTQTSVKNGGDNFSDDEDESAKVIANLPHNQAIADNPLYN
jgi:ATP-dependent Clp protease, protease subunit